MGPLAALVRKEFIQFFRRKPLIVLVIWTISVEIGICAYAITYDVTHIPMAAPRLVQSRAPDRGLRGRLDAHAGGDEDRRHPPRGRARLGEGSGDDRAAA